MNIFENFKNLGKIKSDDLDYEIGLDVIEQSEDLEESREEKHVFKISYYYLIVFIVFCVYLAQIFKLQVVEGSQHQYLAEGNRIRTEEYRAPRGIIYDKHMNPLVKNVPLYNLEIFPFDLPKEKNKRIEIYEIIQEHLPENINEYITDIESGKLFSAQPIVLKSYLQKDEAIRYQLFFNDLAGVRISVMPGREYQNIPGLSHILGYIGKINQDQLKAHTAYTISDFIGQTGLESSYESYLKGEKGRKKVEVDASGRIQRQLQEILPVPGYDVISTIDKALQEKSAESTIQMMENLNKEGKNVEHAVVVAVDPRNGAILSMVSIPSYDNNLFSKDISLEDYKSISEDPKNPMLNRAISGIYPSGSVIKPFIAAAALDKGVISEHTTIDAPKEIKVGEWSFVDWKQHGIVDVKKSIAVSCNIFFYAIGGGWEHIKGIGSEAMKEYLERFGFGHTSGVELSGEQKGNVPSAQWKKDVKDENWYLGDTYHMAIGQGDVLVTPLQMVMALSAVANGGTLYQPRFIDKIMDKEKNIIKSFEDIVLNDKIVDDPYSIEVVRKGMKLAVDSSDGSARSLQELPVTSGGKTGTAQFDATDLKRTHAWFEAFAPYDDPEIAIIVLVEAGGDGFDAAVPIAKEILQFYFESK